MNIEDLIKNRRNELDHDTPPPELWDSIRNRWNTEKKRTVSYWKVAAVIFITLSAGLLIHNISLQQKVEELASLGDISEEYQKIETQYINQINVIEAGIQMDAIKQAREYAWIFEELNALEEVNRLYRKDIGKVQKDQLVNVLIDHYEKKIRLLKKLELEIQRTNKTRNDEKDNTDSISI